MSHDRGCPCGNERWDFRECAIRKGDDCYRYHLVQNWEPPKTKPRIRVKAATERVDAT